MTRFERAPVRRSAVRAAMLALAVGLLAIAATRRCSSHSDVDTQDTHAQARLESPTTEDVPLARANGRPRSTHAPTADVSPHRTPPPQSVYVGMPGRFPIAGAHVEITSPGSPTVRLTTGADGIASVPDPVDGPELHVLASAPGYLSRETVWNTEQTPVLNVFLSHALERTGTVLDGVSGAPIAGARIFPADPATPETATMTDALGRFGHAFPQGVFATLVEVSASGYVARRFDLAASPPGTLTVWLDPSGTVVGSVYSPQGEPIPNVSVSAVIPETGASIDEELVPPPVVKTDAHGRYRLTGLRIGAHYAVTCDDRDPWKAPLPVAVVTAPDSRQVTANLAMREMGTLRVTLDGLDPSDGLGAGIRVGVPAEAQQQATASGERAATFHGLPTGTVHVHAFTASQMSAWRTATVEGRTTTECSIDMTPTHRISGVVVDDVGQVVRSAVVLVTEQCECGFVHEVSVRSDSGGAFGVTGGGSMPWEVAVSRPEHGTWRRVVTSTDEDMHSVLERTSGIRFAVRWPASLSSDTSWRWRLEDKAGRTLDEGWRSSLAPDSIEVQDVSSRASVLRIEIDGMLPGTYALCPEPGKVMEMGEIVFREDEGVTVRGTVVNDQGAPVEVWRVQALSQPGERVVAATTKQRLGAFELVGLPDLPLTLRVFAHGFPSTDVAVPPGSQFRHADVVISRGGRLSVRVVDIHGFALDAVVRAESPGGKRALPLSPTMGAFVGLLPVGNWTVVAERDGQRVQSPTVVCAGDNAVLVLRFKQD